MSLPRISGRNISNNSKGVSDILQNWGTAPSQQERKALRRKVSQENFGRDLQQISTSLDSPTDINIPYTQDQKDFRDEFQIDGRGPMRIRPMSNQQSQLIQPQVEIQLPQSMSAERLMKFNATVDGKALLHDLDQKFEQQDRVINFLLQQFNTVEATVQNLNKKTQIISDNEREARFKMENSLKYNNDQASYSQQEIVAKLNSLEDQIKREEKVRFDMRERLRLADEANREMMNFIRSLQSQSEQELTQMRTFLQEKLNDDHLSTVKQKEKSTVLFNEVVRLGQEYEKQIEFLQGLNQQYENRIQTIESRLASTEQNTFANEKRGDVNQTMLNDIIEKLEGKIINMEQNFHFVKNELGKERDNLSRLEISSLRYNEDFKNIISSVQNEFQGRLEIKMIDLVNRLLLEGEERMRSLDDIRYQMDIKEKMNQEKSKHERDEMRDRYSAMDAIVRSEFQRKDEAILALQNSLETQIRTINGWIKQEELARTQQEISLRTEIGKIADGVRYDVEGFKGQQVQVTEKLSEMIKMEVDSRLSSDKEMKSLIQNLIKNVMMEVATVKDSSEKTIQKLMKDVKDTAHDSAERAHFLSRYIDEEIIKIGQKVTKQIENIKMLCAKLTEQFKKHLINHENMKKDIYKRFEVIEQHLPLYRSEIYKILESTETRCLGKMKEVKDAIEQTMLTNFQVLDERVDQFSELVDSNMDTLRKAVQDNREVFVSVINKTNEELEARQNALVEDLEKVVNEVYELQLKLDGGDKNTKDDSTKLTKIVNDLEAHINTSIITEKSVRKAQDHQLAEAIDSINKKLAIVTDKLQVQIDAEGNQMENHTNKLEKAIKDAQIDISKFGTELQDLTKEYQTFKQKQTQDTCDIIAKLYLEIMQDQFDSYEIHEKLDKLMQGSSETDHVMKEKFEQFVKESPNNKELEEEKLKKMQELMDSKVQDAFEKLRNDNLFIWKQSIELAQKEFNEKGVGQTMNFLPKTLLDRNDLKRTVNSLILEDTSAPRPLLKQNFPGGNQKPIIEESKLSSQDHNQAKASPNSGFQQQQDKLSPNIASQQNKLSPNVGGSQQNKLTPNVGSQQNNNLTPNIGSQQNSQKLTPNVQSQQNSQQNVSQQNQSQQNMSQQQLSQQQLSSQQKTGSQQMQKNSSQQSLGSQQQQMSQRSGSQRDLQ